MTRIQLQTKRIDTIFKIQKVIESLEGNDSNNKSKEKVITGLYKKQTTINTSMLILDEIVFGNKDVAATYRKNRTNAVAIKLAMAVLLRSQQEQKGASNG